MNAGENEMTCNTNARTRRHRTTSCLASYIRVCVSVRMRPKRMTTNDTDAIGAAMIRPFVPFAFVAPSLKDE